MTGQGDRWDKWTFTAPDGRTGTFTLDAAMTGTGSISAGAAPQAALRWTDATAGTLDLIGSGQEQVSPSATARDFQITHWVGNAALLGPTPMY